MAKMYRGIRTENDVQTSVEVYIEVDGKRDRELTPDHSQAFFDSRNGFEWGYGGSGPTQLALALLLEELDDEQLALAYYLDFKRDIIAHLDSDEWRLSPSDIRSDIRRRTINTRLNIDQIDCERCNQTHISKVTPEDPPEGEFRYNYTGYFGCDFHCTLEICDKSIVICTEDEDAICTEDEEDVASSITNLAEHLATRVAWSFQIRAEHLIWIQHLKWEETWALVQFNVEVVDKGNDPLGFRFLLPRWQRISKAVVDALRDQYRPPEQYQRCQRDNTTRNNL